MAFWHCAADGPEEPGEPGGPSPSSKSDILNLKRRQFVWLGQLLYILPREVSHVFVSFDYRLSVQSPIYIYSALYNIQCSAILVIVYLYMGFVMPENPMHCLHARPISHASIYMLHAVCDYNFHFIIPNRESFHLYPPASQRSAVSWPFRWFDLVIYKRNRAQCKYGWQIIMDEAQFDRASEWSFKICLTDLNGDLKVLVKSTTEPRNTDEMKEVFLFFWEDQQQHVHSLHISVAS